MTETNPHSTRVVETLKRLLRRNASGNIRNILERMHPADAAHVLGGFLSNDRLRLLDLIADDERKAEVVASMSLAQAVDLVGDLPVERVVAMVREMSADDRADLLGALDDELVREIIEAMPAEESNEVNELLRYAENTAGGIMVPDVLAVRDEMTVAEAIRLIQESPDVEMAFYLYVVNDHGLLVGVLSLRQLVVSRPASAIKDLMNPHVISVQTYEDQEEVARIVSRYDFLAVPVVDEANKLVGMVTVDDVIDVIREEATEDILKMAGAGEVFDERRSVLGSVLRRAPWLFAALVGGMIAAIVIGRFEDTLERYVALATFIPVIIGMAGNVGTQSLAIVVRGLATRRIEVKQFWHVVGGELAAGVMLGVVYGAALGGMGFFQLRESAGGSALAMAAVVGGAAAAAMAIAAIVAAVMPMFFARLHIDPAVATGPFVTTAIDILGVVIYFNFVTYLV